MTDRSCPGDGPEWDEICTDCDCCGCFTPLSDLPGCSFYGPFTCTECVRKLAAGEPVADKAGYLGHRPELVAK